MQIVSKTNLSPESTPTTEKITLDVGGMKCAGCVKAVERQLTQHPGVKSACVNLATEVAVVESEIGAVAPEALSAQLTAAGFPTQPRKSGKVIERTQAIAHPAQQVRSPSQSVTRQLIVAILLLILSGIGHFGSATGYVLPVLHNIWFHCGLATVALLIPGRPILIDGWRGWLRNAPNMNTLVGLGTLTAYTASLVALLFPQMGWECFFDEPVMMLGFILVGRTLEQQARNRATAAFKQLLALQPTVARLIAKPPGRVGEVNSSSVVEIPAELVRVGEWLQVLPGDKIPVDGEVVDGRTTVDESMLTGEAMPVIKQTGDTVAAGTLNQSGVIAIVATRIGSETTLAQILALVEAAQTRKAPVQRLADTVAGYFTYGVFASAVLTFGFWYFIGTHIFPNLITHSSSFMSHGSSMMAMHESTINNQPLLLSLKLAIAVMVVACPCALGLATPTAILVGTAKSAEQGLLIKGGDVLERVHKLNTIVFDKTGTLTTGNPVVTDCLLLEVGEQSALLQLAAAVESGTSHPLAKAIQTEAEKQQLSIPVAVDFHTEPGFGVSAVVNDTLVLLGNWDWLRWHGITTGDALPQAQKLAAEGKTVVYVAIGEKLAGLIAVQDPLRSDAVSVVNKLHQIGLRVILLSGDSIEAASFVAEKLGLDSTDVMASVPPAKKAAVIQSLQQLKSIVAMVGDGINDAPALSQADVGIALHSGTDVAIETADIVLMRDRLSDVVQSIELSRATFNKIQQNLFWAFAYNAMGIPLAAGVLLPSFGFLLSPSGAAALMAFSSVSVVTNSLLLRRFTPRP
ncbi:heavy metal translocating P-type ATPase [Iningainema tapete]|uniref:Copper-translocating P-type ATPase n=1 Tax=Iningainema tapete BLCC-T55 TaxID=2748662 RepID=A0A8J6XL38_9CYAN|nr:heavy metal translocating P-type ATPase [Iningainema tapete]MBD2774716.1 copper-translocating P-type ATPase [Iningainema tapete BLCC-T55]